MMDFILASASARRKELLEKAGYRFSVVVSDVDEEVFGNPVPIERAKEIAMAKAMAVAKDWPKSLVLGADTIAQVDGDIIGKPTDVEDAERIVRKLFSKPHEVITGVAIICVSQGIEIVDADVTTVYPKAMSEEQIRGHLDGGSWQGKAGAYAIQETGDEFVETLDGSMTNVMGLPMEMVSRLLERLLKK